MKPPSILKAVMQNISRFTAIHQHPLHKNRSTNSRAGAEGWERKRDDASLSPCGQRGSAASSPQNVRFTITLSQPPRCHRGAALSAVRAAEGEAERRV